MRGECFEVRGERCGMWGARCGDGGLVFFGEFEHADCATTIRVVAW